MFHIYQMLLYMWYKALYRFYMLHCFVYHLKILYLSNFFNTKAEYYRDLETSVYSVSVYQCRT